MTKSECSSLRGYAIMAIMLHNYCHWIPKAARENEFCFDADRTVYFLNSIISTDFFIHFFSFMGHLGVPIFVFLSGYGLSKKYDSDDNLDYKSFLAYHYLKLFKPLVIGTAIFLLVIVLKYGVFACSIPRLMLQCTMTFNLVYPYEQQVIPRAYWYFGMAMELYLLYISIVYKHSIKILLLITLLSLVVTILLGINYECSSILIWFKYNAFGWLLPFFLGVYLSRYPVKTISKGWKLFGLFLFSWLLFFCNYYYITWIFIPLNVVFFAMFLIQLHPSWLLDKTTAFGKLSLYIFVVHPIVREVTLPIGVNTMPYLGLTIYVALSLLISFTFYYFIEYKE